MKTINPDKQAPYNIGINRAKRAAHVKDVEDNRTVQSVIGVGHPRQHQHHQTLVHRRHHYYARIYQSLQERKHHEYEHAARLSAIGFGEPSESLSTAGVGTHAGGVPQPETGAVTE